jgi:hypothetical protein
MNTYHLYILNPYNLVYISGQSCASKTENFRAIYFGTEVVSRSFLFLVIFSAFLLLVARMALAIDYPYFYYLNIPIVCYSLVVSK